MKMQAIRSKLWILPYFICMFLLNSCSRSLYLSGNADLTLSNLAKVIEGRSTKYELISILGEPDQIVIGHDKSSVENLLNISSPTRTNIIPDGTYEAWHYYVRNRIILNLSEERYSEKTCFFIINTDDVIIKQSCNDKTVMNYSDFDRSPEYVVEKSLKKNDYPAGLEKKIIMQLNINFNLNSVTIKHADLDQLKQMAELMKTYPDTTALIEGHTDNRGSAARNLNISRRRAQSIKKYFTDTFGISQERITAEGFGDTRPIASNDTPEGRRKNRRVLVVLYDNAGNP
jgi:outer membrane protein OmpA-like peptidoglycan-associated protein